jgi:hypothetical protein
MRREIEVVLAVVVIFYGIRTGMPLTPGALDTGWALVFRVAFGLLVLVPGVLLLMWADPASRRAKALLGVAASNLYATAAIVIAAPTWFGAAAATAGLSVMAFILYAGARAEAGQHEQ